jgi:hypothetical protein
MKKLFIFLALVLSTSAFAHHNDCVATLTDNYDIETSYHIIDSNDVIWTKDLKNSAINAIKYLLETMGCNKEDYNFGKGPMGKSQSKCSFNIPNNHATMSCYIETNIGYFTVTKDLQERSHIIFHLWD